VFSFKIFIFHEANTCVALPNACRRVRCAHSPSGIKIIMDQKVVKTVELT
jgi:hypothetical protein